MQSIMSSPSEKSKGSKFKDISSISLTFFLYLFSFHALLSSTGYPLIEQPHPPPIPQPPQNPTPVSIDDTAISISEKSSISKCISISFSHLLSLLVVYFITCSIQLKFHFITFLFFYSTYVFNAYKYAKSVPKVHENVSA